MHIFNTLLKDGFFSSCIGMPHGHANREHRLRETTDPRVRFLSLVGRRMNWWKNFPVCLGLSGH